ncbi:MAG: threonine/serine exporter family protein [Clostridiaceae bacterium]|nr:threonine/serine exporter family protein [Clostridiaceae bacterium]
MSIKKEVLIVAIYAGEIMLKNGGETYRVEDTIMRLCKSRGFSYVETFVTPTGIFLSMDKKNAPEEEMSSYIKRIRSRNINLNKISKINEFSRNFVNSSMSTEEAMQALKKIDEATSYSNLTKSIFGGLASGFFALLFQSNLLESLSAFITGMLVTYSLNYLLSRKMPFFLANILGGGILTLLAIFFSYMTPSIHIDKIIIGAIMVMVPGVAITNAVRDSIEGDLVAGLARAGEAFIIAISIAFGVGAVLKIREISSFIMEVLRQ